MSIAELISSYPESVYIHFEYAYLDRDLKPDPDESRSYYGHPSGFTSAMYRKDPAVLHLHAGCGEANDFEIVSENENEVYLRYTDFR